MKAERPAIPANTNTAIVVPFHSAAYPMSALLRNPGPGTVYLGGKGVSSATGFALAMNESLTLDVVNEPLYATATVTTTIQILRRGD